MTLEGFLREREASWNELEALLSRSRGRPERLGAEGTLRLGTLYRAAAADLALARRRFPADPVRTRLERLVGRAGLAIYRRRAERQTLWSFLSRGYWRAVAERPGVLALAACLLLIPAILAAVWATDDPTAAGAFIPADFEGATDPPGDSGATSAERVVFSTELFTHNIQVTFLAFAAGIAAGIGTAIVLAFNGLILGTVAGAAIEAGNGGSFFEFVIPHGPLELSCIIVTAAAGMRMGWALVSPGEARRRDALVAEARRSVAIILGTMPWLVAAGISEAFVRSAGLDSAILLTVGLGLFLAYWTLVAVRGRGEPAADPSAANVDAPAPRSALATSP
jgi:uncharacterized membrane protein SpoIIM required for sporulation